MDRPTPTALLPLAAAAAAGALAYHVIARSRTPAKSPLHDYEASLAAARRATASAEILRRLPDGRAYVTRIVLTGGPCAGKSSSLEHLTAALTAQGRDVLCVPEVPTILMNGGAVFPGSKGSPEELLEFEVALVRAQLQLEDSFIQIAQSTGRPTVVVCDRGLLDVAAYLPAEMWQTVLRRCGLTMEQLIARYDLVIHLVTAADGAEKFYTTANNATRTETPEQARALDRRIVDCYKTHPRLALVPNRGSFDAKLEEATKHALDVAVHASQ